MIGAKYISLPFFIQFSLFIIYSSISIIILSSSFILAFSLLWKKVPKSLAVELFTDANAFNVHFPEGASVEQKAMIAGSAILINANFFEAGSE